ncbi:Methyltransferase domain protein [Maioricimonas rarisocia]|uniref:Alpha N-terminal protein methyltransferase 1 n=1 Tax=Maioricimonas rarisocia TaxID=2528026 RepID=A0A517Z8L5_9PLAN|nr:methyltransferase domain-containing protein [Maioricimonas rarisocia]QDU38827.1 Methyltransferase domain protein [Maioricimonas rarisocia]
MNPIKDNWTFFRQFIEEFEWTGAVLPSGRFASDALSRFVARTSSPRRILEVGPGTGPVTRRMARHLSPDDHLDLVEINPRFVDILNHKFETDPVLKPARGITQIHCCPLQEFEADAPYDLVICGIPFNNLPPDLVAELMDRCLSLLADGGRFSFFEYMYVRNIKQVVGNRNSREQLRGVGRELKKRFESHKTGTDWVFANVPPAWIHHLQARSVPDTRN